MVTLKTLESLEGWVLEVGNIGGSVSVIIIRTTSTTTTANKIYLALLQRERVLLWDGELAISFGSSRY